MDSLTQIALGSAVAVAVMGRRTAVWKAALWGGVAGTLPDLDAFIDHGDAILNMVLHRAETHSLIYLTLFSPLLAWVVSHLHKERHLFLHWWLALWLVLITHPLLDTMTVYGTQLLLPFTDHPFGVGSVFIIDPAYTLPLLAGVVAALALRREGRGLRWNMVGLVLSTAYLGWSVAAQQVATQVARASLQQQGVSADRLLVTPAPFNTVLWRLLAVTPTHYLEGYYSLLDGRSTVRWTAHDRGADLIERHGQSEPVARIANFSHGFYRLRETPDGRLQVTDLRMGQEPTYVFSFDVGPVDAVGSLPASQRSSRPDTAAALAWLWQRARGADLLPLGAALAATQ
ncbi:MAG TPA: metal-dependent hydrolase [Hydrogenophaga sp.]|uniref:metal-dependent hydrolase n=1 Tax=Hydrogenophaga sp. TaxID=1904254 RepID=UPI002C84AC15|nr:metal-dependent hydrolase [Hydrogenophaga sp.]HMN92119.1 metal-dependent hydrolase [Hydrogenophaga sp.]